MLVVRAPGREVKQWKNQDGVSHPRVLSRERNGIATARSKRAMLVIFDRGRASSRVWNSTEGRIIQVFKQNRFGIDLAVARIRLDETSKEIKPAFPFSQ
jgi:hypothetical protein